QCLCCFKEYKHLEVFNQLVYALINLVITQINNLRNQLCTAQNLTHKGSVPGTEEARSDWAGGESAPSLLPQPSSPGEDEPVNVERDSAEEDANTPDLNQNKTQSHDQESSRPDGAQEDPLGPLDGGSESAQPKPCTVCSHLKRYSLDVEVPLHLLRYVCLFCGKHGLSLMKECFELGTPETLPFPIAHAFITIVSNVGRMLFSTCLLIC
ncbi:hypothetical protein XENOCAPTIV_006905, partial [Xenoophorus captivus]